jgi:hypothetical protein
MTMPTGVSPRSAMRVIEGEDQQLQRARRKAGEAGEQRRAENRQNENGTAAVEIG